MPDVNRVIVKIEVLNGRHSYEEEVQLPYDDPATIQETAEEAAVDAVRAVLKTMARCDQQTDD